MNRRRGFTVVELMVGLLVAGIVLLLARATLAEASLSVGTLVDARAQLDQRSTGRRWLASSFRSLQVGLAKDDTFDGSADRLSYSARLLTAHGWFELQRLRLEASGDRVLVRRANGDSLVLYSGVGALETQYLLSTGEQSEWLRGWHSPATCPLAVRLIIWWAAGPPSRSDTLLFFVGSRG